MVTLNLTIDANDSARLARFWAPLLGYEEQPPPAGFDSWVDWYRSKGVPEEELQGPPEDLVDRIHDPSGGGPTIWFQVVPEQKSQKNRFHFDVYVTERDPSLSIEQRRDIVEAKVVELVAQGATVGRRTEGPDAYFVLMHDPEGNEFCLG
ncbi:VOC family protein [Nocardioides sp. CN2-186]|uniref:VOC family protein n=1 Tax=Nocardioides tweenelious TaxID=3156607 RepID=UPI0032B5B12E